MKKKKKKEEEEEEEEEEATNAELSQHSFTYISAVERGNIVRDGKANIESLKGLLTEKNKSQWKVQIIGI